MKLVLQIIHQTLRRSGSRKKKAALQPSAKAPPINSPMHSCISIPCYYTSRPCREGEKIYKNNALAICGALAPHGKTVSQIVRSLPRAGKRSHKLREACPARENALTNCEKLAPHGKTLSQIARSLPRTGKRSRKLREACPARGNALTNCEKLAPLNISINIKEL
jgi:hypothetical protein